MAYFFPFSAFSKDQNIRIGERAYSMMGKVSWKLGGFKHWRMIDLSVLLIVRSIILRELFLISENFEENVENVHAIDPMRVPNSENLFPIVRFVRNCILGAFERSVFLSDIVEQNEFRQNDRSRITKNCYTVEMEDRTENDKNWLPVI